MTPDERERMNSLSIRIQEERDQHQFERLLQELDEVIERKVRRFAGGGSIRARQRSTRPWKTLSGRVARIVPGQYRADAETVEISIPEAEDLYGEIRILNSFTDIDGQPVTLKHQAPVDITLEADAKDTVKKAR